MRVQASCTACSVTECMQASPCVRTPVVFPNKDHQENDCCDFSMICGVPKRDIHRMFGVTGADAAFNLQQESYPVITAFSRHTLSRAAQPDT